MLDLGKLTPADVGRNVTYHRPFCDREYGTLSSWNDKFVFVRFKGPTGEACEPDDVSFDFEDAKPRVDYAAAMKLPDGKTCADCRHVRRCVDVLGCSKPERTSCDFFPNKFVEHRARKDA